MATARTCRLRTDALSEWLNLDTPKQSPPPLSSNVIQDSHLTAAMPLPPSSSPAMLSQQPSLYDFYSPVPTSDSSPAPPSSSSRAPLQESTRQNILPSGQGHRISLKRRLSSKLASSSSPPESPLAKKSKPLVPASHVSNPPVVSPVRRYEARPTIAQSLVSRSLNGSRASLLSCTIGLYIVLTAVTSLYQAKHYFTRPVDMHNIQTSQGAGTFPFAVQCCNSSHQFMSLSDNSQFNDCGL
jgi:hypothetical protein